MLYRCKDIYQEPASRNEKLISVRHSQLMEFLPNRLADFLVNCQYFRSAESHTQDYLSKLRGVERHLFILDIMSFYLKNSSDFHIRKNPVCGVVSDVLKILFKKGLLEEQSEFVGSLQNESDPQSGKISVVGIPTLSRSQSLIRGLQSFVANAQKHNKSVEFVVYDDSQKSDIPNQIYANIDCNRASIKYVGRQEKRKFAEKIVLAGIPSDIVDFCLFGTEGAKTYGANRNAFLLDTVGKLAFSADDDVICRTGKCPQSRNSLKVDVQGNLHEIRYFPDQESAVDSIEFEDRDVLGLHEEVLGKQVSAVIQNHLRHGDSVNFDDLGLRWSSSISAGDSRVTVSMNSLVGDSGSAVNSAIWGLTGEGRARLLSSENHFNEMRSSRNVLKSVKELTIHPATGMMSTFFGLDHRELLPPFFPIHRNEDALFGRMLSACCSQASFAQLPWALVHAPMETRNTTTTLRTTSLVYMEEIIFQILKRSSSAFLPGQDTISKISIFSENLNSVSQYPDHELNDILLRTGRRRTVESIQTLEAALEEKAPSFFKRFVQEQLMANRNLLQSKSYRVYQEPVEKMTEGLALDHLKRQLFLYARLLKYWPQMCQIAKGLRSQGEGLGFQIKNKR